MSASSSLSTNDYFCKLRHKLKLIKEGEEAVLQECEYCKDQIFNLGSCYRCTDCKGFKYFHKACLKAKRDSTKVHAFIPDVTLKLSSPAKKDYFNCTACRHAVRGIMYAGKDNHLHPQCIELPRILRLENIRLKDNYTKALQIPNFTLELSSGLTSMECDYFCQSKKVKGWCYRNYSNGESIFACHVYCLRKRLAEEWFNKQRVEHVVENLYRDDLRKILKKLIMLKTARWGLKAAKLILNLIIWAFVGAPLSTFVSGILNGTFEFAIKILERREKKLLEEEKYGGN